MAEKQQYVKVTFEYGSDEDGEYTPKNTGNVIWASMPYEAAVTLQNYAIIPAFTMIMEKAGELGMEASGSTLPPGQAKK